MRSRHSGREIRGSYEKELYHDELRTGHHVSGCVVQPGGSFVLQGTSRVGHSGDSGDSRHAGDSFPRARLAFAGSAFARLAFAWNAFAGHAFTWNALAGHAFTRNAFTRNAFAWNAFAWNAFAWNAFTGHAFTGFSFAGLAFG